jgi:hypothetical protein
MIGRNVNPVLLDRALSKFVDERLEIHAHDLRVGGANEDTINRGVEHYRVQLLEQLLKMVIKNGPDWFGGDDWGAVLEALPKSGVSH